MLTNWNPLDTKTWTDFAFINPMLKLQTSLGANVRTGVTCKHGNKKKIRNSKSYIWMMNSQCFFEVHFYNFFMNFHVCMHQIINDVFYLLFWTLQKSIGITWFEKVNVLLLNIIKSL